MNLEAPTAVLGASPSVAVVPSKPNGGDSDSRPSGAEMLGDAAFSPDSNFRVRCSWCPDKAPMDGLGPIPDDARVSDGLCLSCADRLIAQLDANPGAPICGGADRADTRLTGSGAESAALIGVRPIL